MWELLLLAIFGFGAFALGWTARGGPTQGQVPPDDDDPVPHYPPSWDRDWEEMV